MTTPRRPPRLVEEGFAVACMVLLVLITLANVVTRYLTEQSFAWTEEISIFLMVLMTLAGASAAAARDRHIRIELVYEGGSAERQRRLKIFGACTAALTFLLLALLFGRMVWDEWRFGETTMGLGIPRWWLTFFLPLLSLLIAWRCLSVALAAGRAEEGLG